MDRHFEIKKVDSIALIELEQIKELVISYRIESDDHEATVDQIIQRIQDSIPYGVWFIYEGAKVCGFLVCSIMQDTYKNTKCFVDYLFATHEIRFHSIVKELCQVGIDWVKAQGIKKIIFVTRRNADVMCKFLPGKWVKDSTVLSLCA